MKPKMRGNSGAPNEKLPKGAKKRTLSRLLKYIFKYYKGSFAMILICIIFSSIAGVGASIFLQYIIDDCIMPGLANGLDTVYTKLIIGIGVIGGVYVLGIVASLIQSQLVAKVSQNFLHKIRTDMFDHMQMLPIKYFDTHTHGDIMSYYTNDVDTLRQLIAQSIPQLMSSVITIVAIFFLMLSYSLWLTLIVIASVVAMFFVTAKIGGKSAKYFVKQQQSLAKTEGYIEEIMHGQKVVKVFSHEAESQRKFDEYNGQLFKDAESANKFANILMPILGNIGNILYVLLAFIGAALALSGAMNISLRGIGDLTVGVIVSFLTMSKMFTMSISQLSQQMNSIVMALAGGSRVFGLLDEPVEEDHGYVTLVNANVDDNGVITECKERTGIWAWKHPHKADGTITYTLLKGDIEMHEVDFGYTEEKIVLHDVTLYAKEGQKIAFVGATGAGKTTITNLINRFYDIADGKIRYDGININKIKKSDLRRSLGIVLQDTNLFTGTVMDNIRYGRLNATDEECIAASKLANAHDFVTRLPDGYDTMLTSDGSNLSQGQRQLLSIARAAVADAPVMIMDEATSSIDTRTEILVQKGTDRLMQGRTVFVIAHRLSTVQNADVIMVLDKGRIIERGSHKELIEKKGNYYQLYTGAFELE